METIHDVLRRLAKLLGAGPEHDQAVAIINSHDPDHHDDKPAEAPAEGTQPS